MKRILYILLLITAVSFSQEKDKAELLALKKANDYVYEGNDLIGKEDFVLAEMAYRKAISEKPETIAGMYNLGNSYYEKGAYNEALFRLQQAAKTAISKAEKHKAFHNIGNILMKNKQCKEAVEAYKNALRNNPTDDETRYNLGLAKICAEEQKNQDDQNQDDQNQDQDKNQDSQEDNQDQDKKNDENKDQENEDNKDGEDKEDKKDKGDEEDENGKPEDKNKDQGKGDQEKEQPQPQQGQLSPQQINSLLEAMSNQEQKIQEKMNEEKQKGVIIKTDKDW
ncbi:aerotolerance regulator BatC [Pseudalgibacter alginicilyticus]|uniref:Aerotolerance regulator BatC n=1 Tax=Pseudalgibacter alginicilyticus TaxID=1736674 RepID=A0A0P0DC80_9FLAO|nr:tetratricopeptide repeat protein [Pseudalgibacter alginicilyticus]ALJ05717.1 aerotolerance regulator BatC [Pseudalgibacter alginicilyticus]